MMNFGSLGCSETNAMITDDLLYIKIHYFFVSSLGVFLIGCANSKMNHHNKIYVYIFLGDTYRKKENVFDLDTAKTYAREASNYIF